MPYKDLAARNAYQRTWRIAHLEKERARERGYDLSHRDKKRAYDQVYRVTHLKERKTLLRAWYQSHTEEVKAYGATYRATHKSESNERRRAYLSAHPGMNAAAAHRRRAHKVSAQCTATVEHERAIKAAYKYRCAYCGNRSRKLTIDHVIPLAKRGTHTPENLVPACKSCNSRKHTNKAPSIPPTRLLL